MLRISGAKPGISPWYMVCCPDDAHPYRMPCPCTHMTRVPTCLSGSGICLTSVSECQIPLKTAEIMIVAKDLKIDSHLAEVPAKVPTTSGPIGAPQRQQSRTTACDCPDSLTPHSWTWTHWPRYNGNLRPPRCIHHEPPAPEDTKEKKTYCD